MKIDSLNAHPTKKGPGRTHGQGVPHPGHVHKPKGAPRGFSLHTNPYRRLVRVAKRIAGSFRKFSKDPGAYLPLAAREIELRDAPNHSRKTVTA